MNVPWIRESGGPLCPEFQSDILVSIELDLGAKANQRPTLDIRGTFSPLLCSSEDLGVGLVLAFAHQCSQVEETQVVSMAPGSLY